MGWRINGVFLAGVIDLRLYFVVKVGNTIPNSHRFFSAPC